MPLALERETEDHEACKQERERRVDDRETGFGLEAAAVAADVDMREDVVEIMADGFGEDGCDDGGEEEEAC